MLPDVCAGYFPCSMDEKTSLRQLVRMIFLSSSDAKHRYHFPDVDAESNNEEQLEITSQLADFLSSEANFNSFPKAASHSETG